MSWMKLFTKKAMSEEDKSRLASHREDGKRAGRRIGQLLRLDRLSRLVYRCGCAHKKAFLVISFGLVGGLFLYNTISMMVYMSKRSKVRRPVTEYVDSVMEKNKHRAMFINEE